MKAKLRFCTSALGTCGVFSALLASNIWGQTLLNLATQSRNADFTNFPYTRPVKTGASLPSTCVIGDMFLNTNAAAGKNLFICLTSNSWVQQAGLSDPGTDGVVRRSGTTTSTIPAPTGSLVGTSDTQTLTNKSLDASEITTGVLSSSRIPALTGDVTTASGSSLSTLATVNTSPGTYGDATHSVQLTVDAKGRVTSVSPLAITGMGQTSPIYYQQVAKIGNSLTQRGTLNLSGAFSVTDNSSATRTDLDLAQVNSNPGTFGSTSQIPVITVNTYGQITNVSTAAMASTSGSNSVQATSGAFSSIPASCSTGALYLATDQPIGQQLYTCSSSNTWSSILSVGPSGGLALSGGSLDIVTSVIPRLTAANTFTGTNTFAGSLQMAPLGSQPTCSSTVRGSLWFQNNGTAKDALQVCVFNGSAYAWVNLY